MVANEKSLNISFSLYIDLMTLWLSVESYNGTHWTCGPINVWGQRTDAKVCHCFLWKSYFGIFRPNCIWDYIIVQGKNGGEAKSYPNLDQTFQAEWNELNFPVTKIQPQPKQFSGPSLINFPEDRHLSRNMLYLNAGLWNLIINKCYVFFAFDGFVWFEICRIWRLYLETNFATL